MTENMISPRQDWDCAAGLERRAFIIMEEMNRLGRELVWVLEHMDSENLVSSQLLFPGSMTEDDHYSDFGPAEGVVRCEMDLFHRILEAIACVIAVAIVAAIFVAIVVLARIYVP